jgi:hypothetical protein
LKERQEGRDDEEAEISSYRMTLRKEKIPVFERRSGVLHSVENSLWEMLRAGCVMNEWVVIKGVC